MAPSGTPATGPDTEPRPGWWPLAIISSAHLMAVLDTTIMFVALPSIQHALKMTDSSRQWVVTAYTLALAGLLLLGGRLTDKLGLTSHPTRSVGRGEIETVKHPSPSTYPEMYDGRFVRSLR